MFEVERTGITSLSPFAVFDESTSTGINTVNALKLEVYPNPATNVFFVTYDSPQQASIELLDLRGRVIERNVTNGSNRTEINISDLPNGMYMLRIVSDNATTTKQVIKS